MVASRYIDSFWPHVRPFPYTYPALGLPAPFKELKRPLTNGRYRSLILAIIFYVTTQCRVIDSWVTEQSGFIAANWLTGISRYLLIATIMIPIIRRLHQSAGKKKKKKTTLITAIHGVYLAILAIILICRLSIYTYMKYKQGLDGDYYLHRYKAHLVQNYPRIVTAYDVLGVVGILMASGNMVLLLVRNSALWRMVSSSTLLLFLISFLFPRSKPSSNSAPRSRHSKPRSYS